MILSKIAEGVSKDACYAVRFISRVSFGCGCDSYEAYFPAQLVGYPELLNAFIDEIYGRVLCVTGWVWRPSVPFASVQAPFLAPGGAFIQQRVMGVLFRRVPGVPMPFEWFSE